MKICSKCKILKELNYFWKNSRQKDNKCPQCIICMKIVKERNKELHRPKDKEKVKQYNKKYSLQNKIRNKERRKIYTKNNIEKIKSYAKIYNKSEEQIQKNKVRCKNYTKNNKEKKKMMDKNYRKNNKGMINALSAKYRNLKLNATPKWLTKEHHKQIKNIYKESIKLQQLDNIPRDVDHIIPIQSKLVCGLHVPWNLQILTRKDNQIKKNKLILEVKTLTDDTDPGV